MRKSYKDDHENNVKFYTDISTYTDSYRIFKDVQAERFRNRRENTEKPKLKRLPMTSIDLETFTPLKHKIPLGLMIVPNEVTRGNPQASIQHIVSFFQTSSMLFLVSCTSNVHFCNSKQF